MDKDLFYSLFCKESKYSYDFYLKNVLWRLPRLLINTALESAPEIEHCTGFEELNGYLDDSCKRSDIWRNSELYPYLNYLAFPNNAKRQLCVNSLMVHCGLEKLNSDTNPDVCFWRYTDKTPIVIYSDGKDIIECEDIVWVIKINDKNIKVFRPLSNLFDDVEPSLYGSQKTTRTNEDIDELLRSAFEIIGRYSPQLCARIVNHLSTIAFLKESDSRPHSYTLRNLYIGGIFVSITSPIEVAEQIIHEYYHQCIWPWWMVDPPSDLPDTEDKIKSPITGATRSLPTMIQAALIYASLIDFYEYIEEFSVIDPKDALQSRYRDRFDTMVSGYRLLIESLNCHLATMPITKGILSSILVSKSELSSESECLN